MKKIINCIDCINNKGVQLDLAGSVVNSLMVQDKIADKREMFIAPGLIDVQVNGYAGIDFNTYPISEDDFLKAIDALVREGVTSFFPTVITNSDENILKLLKNIDDLCKTNSLIDAYVGGVHLEGPFISPKDGPRGAHGQEFVKAPDWELFAKFHKASGNRIKIVTLSPEWEEANSFISKCKSNDIIAAIGHTDATPLQIKAAVKAGASMSTHLGNGAALQLPRNSNFIIEQLSNEHLAASFIADGFHLTDSFLRVAFKQKKDKAILVSDSTMFAGMKSGIYKSHIGGEIQLENNGRLSMASNANFLAGAALSMFAGIRRIVLNKLVDLSEAWSMGSENVKILLDKDYSSDYLESVGSDYVLFEMTDDKIFIKQVIKEGKLVFSQD